MFWGCRNALRPTPAFQDHPSSNQGSLCRQAAAGPRPTHRLCPCPFPVQPSAGGSAACRGLWKSTVSCQQCLLPSACGSQWGWGHRTAPARPHPHPPCCVWYSTVGPKGGRHPAQGVWGSRGQADDSSMRTCRNSLNSLCGWGAKALRG